MARRPRGERPNTLALAALPQAAAHSAAGMEPEEAGPAACHTLPAPLSSLLGSDTRLVIVVGAGGVSKTRLALAAAWTLRPRFADRAWWADLTGIQPAHDPAFLRTRCRAPSRPPPA